MTDYFALLDEPRRPWIEPDALKLVPSEVALRHLLIPISRTGSVLIVAMCDPSNVYAVDELSALVGLQIEPVVASEPAIRDANKSRYPSAGDN